MQKKVSKTLSIVVAVYKNEESIGPFLTRLEKSVHTNIDSFDFEIIIVDDGTPDKTIVEIDKYMELGTTLKIRKIALSRNFGQMSAILAGMSVSTGDAIVNISADLQDPPELLTEMLTSYIAGNKVVICLQRLNR
jgi:dolichol-phosphate mannosyltransferase